MEAELQDMDGVKMENIELRCRLEESENKLSECQQQMMMTSQHLEKLEDLATHRQHWERDERENSVGEVNQLR